MPIDMNHPKEGATILINLYEGPVRSKYLVKKAQSIDEMSPPTIYAILKTLEESGYIEKQIKSPRNVQYIITDKGREFVEKEHFKTRDTILNAIRNNSENEEILMSLLLEQILKQLPTDWQKNEKREKLIIILKEEIASTKKRLIDIVNTAEGG